MIKQVLSECHFSQNNIQSLKLNIWTFPIKQTYTSHAKKVCNIIDTEINYTVCSYFDNKFGNTLLNKDIQNS